MQEFVVGFVLGATPLIWKIAEKKPEPKPKQEDPNIDTLLLFFDGKIGFSITPWPHFTCGDSYVSDCLVCLNDRYPEIPEQECKALWNAVRKMYEKQQEFIRMHDTLCGEKQCNTK